MGYKNYLLSINYVLYVVPLAQRTSKFERNLKILI